MKNRSMNRFVRTLSTDRPKIEDANNHWQCLGQLTETFVVGCGVCVSLVTSSRWPDRQFVMLALYESQGICLHNHVLYYGLKFTFADVGGSIFCSLDLHRVERVNLSLKKKRETETEDPRSLEVVFEWLISPSRNSRWPGNNWGSVARTVWPVKSCHSGRGLLLSNTRLLVLLSPVLTLQSSPCNYPHYYKDLDS